MISKNSTNLSFKETQYKLQDNGVENAFFMNELKDSSLDNIDVYEQIAKFGNNTNAKAVFIRKVINECKNNIWYYFREVVRIPDDFHISAHVSTGLAKYPLNEYIAKYIYLHSLGCSIISTVSEKEEDTDITFLTMAALGIYYEYINAHRKTAYINTVDVVFKSMMNSLRWAMNDILGNIDGVYPLISDPNNFKIFTYPSKRLNKDIKFDDGVNVYIDPAIYTSNDLNVFLHESKKRNNSNIIGRIVKSNNSNNSELCFDIATNYIFDQEFYQMTCYNIFDNHSISTDRLYLI